MSTARKVNLDVLAAATVFLVPSLEPERLPNRGHCYWSRPRVNGRRSPAAALSTPSPSGSCQYAFPLDSLRVLPLASVVQETSMSAKHAGRWSRNTVSPTVFRHGIYRFYFFSREEVRPHVHVASPQGEAKFWLDPEIALCRKHGLTARQVSVIWRLIVEHESEIRKAWQTYFGG